MKKQQSKAQQYRQLRDIWYKKLKKDGFEDKEYTSGKLKVYDSVRRWAESKQNLKEEYYRLAAHFLEEGIFLNSFERSIWEYHASGISIRNIVKIFKKLRTSRVVNRDSVWQIINKYRREMFAAYGVVKSDA